MAVTPRPYSPLYYRLLLIRRTLPLLAIITVLIIETMEHYPPLVRADWPAITVELLILGMGGPAVLFVLLSWLLERVRERDEAEGRLRLMAAHEQELLAQLKRAIQTERQGLAPTLDHILAAVAADHSLDAAGVYVFEESGRGLPASGWPGPEAHVLLAEHARAGIDGRGQVVTAQRGRQFVTVPLAGGETAAGVLVLAGPVGGRLPERNMLGVIAGVIALLVRNDRLHAALQSRAVLEERNELAREVHDSVAQSLGFLSVKSEHVWRLLNRGQVDAAARALEELCEGSREGYREVRDMIESLRSPAGPEAGMVVRLREFGRKTAARTGLEIAVHAEADPDIPPETQAQLFRIVQEALNNVRHAKACHVRVELLHHPDGLELVVQDDGSGFSLGADHAGAQERKQTPVHGMPGSPVRYGMQIMDERVKKIGGHLHVTSRPGEGTTVRIRIPAGAPEREAEELTCLPSLS